MFSILDEALVGQPPCKEDIIEKDRDKDMYRDGQRS